MQQNYEYRTIVTPESIGYDPTKEYLLEEEDYELYLPVIRSNKKGEGFIYQWRRVIEEFSIG